MSYEPPQAPYGAPYWSPQVPPGPPVRRKRRSSWFGRHKMLTAIGGVAALLVIGIIAGGGGNKGSQPAAQTAATSPASTAAAAVPAAVKTKAATAPRITYVVTGTAGADVTYGPEGTELTGSVPMKVTAKLGSAGYYSIQVQLQGYGHVTAKIEINGRVISSGTADGGYNIAMAEISQDPITGKWEDTQG